MYDENDGFFDHVAPPVPPAGTPGEYLTQRTLPSDAKGIRGPVGLSFRVPLLVDLALQPGRPRGVRGLRPHLADALPRGALRRARPEHLGLAPQDGGRPDVDPAPRPRRRLGAGAAQHGQRHGVRHRWPRASRSSRSSPSRRTCRSTRCPNTSRCRNRNGSSGASGVRLVGRPTATADWRDGTSNRVRLYASSTLHRPGETLLGSSTTSCAFRSFVVAGRTRRSALLQRGPPHRLGPVCRSCCPLFVPVCRCAGVLSQGLLPPRRSALRPVRRWPVASVRCASQVCPHSVGLPGLPRLSLSPGLRRPLSSRRLSVSRVPAVPPPLAAPATWPADPHPSPSRSAFCALLLFPPPSFSLPGPPRFSLCLLPLPLPLLPSSLSLLFLCPLPRVVIPVSLIRTTPISRRWGPFRPGPASRSGRPPGCSHP